MPKAIYSYGTKSVIAQCRQCGFRLDEQGNDYTEINRHVDKTGHVVDVHKQVHVTYLPRYERDRHD